MAKTIAELSGVTTILSDRLDTTRLDIAALWTANETLADSLDTCRIEGAISRERLENIYRQLDEAREAGRIRDRELAEIRQETALLRQRLDDYLKRVEVWSGRLWTLVTVLIGAVLTLASGLIVTLVRK